MGRKVEFTLNGTKVVIHIGKQALAGRTSRDVKEVK